jgi:hypothetical protein
MFRGSKVQRLMGSEVRGNLLVLRGSVDVFE